MRKDRACLLSGGIENSTEVRLSEENEAISAVGGAHFMQWAGALAMLRQIVMEGPYRLFSGGILERPKEALRRGCKVASACR